jgi:hypothetical protein
MSSEVLLLSNYSSLLVNGHWVAAEILVAIWAGAYSPPGNYDVSFNMQDENYGSSIV